MGKHEELRLCPQCHAVLKVLVEVAEPKETKTLSFETLETEQGYFMHRFEENQFKAALVAIELLSTAIIRAGGDTSVAGKSDTITRLRDVLKRYFENDA